MPKASDLPLAVEFPAVLTLTSRVVFVAVSRQKTSRLLLFHHVFWCNYMLTCQCNGVPNSDIMEILMKLKLVAQYGKKINPKLGIQQKHLKVHVKNEC